MRILTCGLKGLIALRSLDTENREKIHHVVIDKDDQIIEDYADKTALWCEKYKVPWKFNQQNDKIIWSANRSPFTCTICMGWRYLLAVNGPVIVFHDSLLPKYRGFNPLVTALICGEKETGVTAFLASKKPDMGDIIATRKISVNYPIKIKEAIEIMGYEYGELLNEFLSTRWEKLRFISQDHSNASYSLWRDEEDYHIPWHKDSDYVVRFIHAVGFPYKGAFTYLNHRKIRILDAQIVNDVDIANRTPGKVLFKNENEYTIICGKGLISVNAFYNDGDYKLISMEGFRLRFT
ncbi:MAG TPA: formyltransferase family protein [Saprospiraceae bacterium]|nr:formyltransferase family protein [Saprospiraceae bacterium]